MSTMNFKNFLKRVAPVCLGSMLCVSAFAAGGPKLYGNIAKEVRYLNQDESGDAQNTKKHRFTGVTDVDGFSAVFGFMGDYNNQYADVNYGLELGANSSVDNGGGESLAIRQVYAELTGRYGALSLGQRWAPSTLRNFAIDPFAGTVFTNNHRGDSNITGAAVYAYVGGLGYKDQGYADGIGYTTPSWNGLSYNFYLDLNENTSLTKNGDYRENYNHTLMFDRKFGMIMTESTLNYGWANQDTVVSQNEDKWWQLGTKLSMDRFSFSAAYGVSEGGFYRVELTGGASSAPATIKFDRLFLGLAYEMSKNLTLATTYGHLSMSDSFFSCGAAYSTCTSATSPAGDTYNGKDRQIALGALYDIHENVTTRLMVARYEVKRSFPIGALATAGSENKATRVVAGVSASF